MRPLKSSKADCRVSPQTAFKNCRDLWSKCHITLGFPHASGVKDPPAMQETRVQSLGGEDPLEKRMATHSSFLAWRIPRTEEPGRLQSMGSQRVGHDLVTKLQQIPY